MKGIKEKLTVFLQETSLHGFKYLNQGYSFGSKLFWLPVLIFTSSFASILINEAFTDWRKNPVITSIDSIDRPLKEIQFPSLTICHEKYFKPDTWALTEIVFNNFDWVNDEKLREDFQPLFDQIFDEMFELILRNNFTDKSYNLVAKIKQDKILTMINKNQTSLEEITQLGRNSFGKYFSVIR